MNNVPCFSIETAKSLVESSDTFPVNFDQAWQWVGYSAKHKAKIKLQNNFEEGVDFSTDRLKTSTGGRPSDSIYLTIKCFKKFAMMAGTEQGDQVREYFLQCEQVARTTISGLTSGASLIEQARLLLATLENQEALRIQQEALAAQQAAIEKSCKQIEAAQQEHAELLKEHEAEFDRLQSPAGHYFSIVGYASLLGVSVDIETAKAIGRKASRLCRDGGYRKGQIRDPRFGNVGTYPQEVLQIVFQEEGYIKRPA